MLLDFAFVYLFLYLNSVFKKMFKLIQIYFIYFIFRFPLNQSIYIKSIQQRNKNKSNMCLFFKGSVWLGGTDFGVEGRWVWESDRSAFTYSAWNTAKGQPNDYFKQNCLTLSLNNNLTWFDQNCVITYQYICERIFFPN